MRPWNTKACQQGAMLTRQIVQLQHFALHINNKHKSRDHQISTTTDGNQGKLHTFGTTTEEESTHTASTRRKCFGSSSPKFTHYSLPRPLRLPHEPPKSISFY